MSKLCVIICCYNKHYVLNNIYSFLTNIIDVENIDFYMINNNIEQHENIKYIYNKKFIVLEGDNTQYEFSGITKCINFLKTTNILKNYNTFLIGTDALFNHPIYYFDFLNKDLFECVEKNEICIGNIDNFGREYKFDNFMLKHWIRSSMIIISASLFKKVDYCFMSYKLNDIYGNKKFKIDYELKIFLKKWLENDRYSYLNTEDKINIKISCIYNEWKFTNNIEKYGKIIDFTMIYYLKYSDEIMTRKNNYVLINTGEYIKKEELDNIINKNVNDQIILKNKIIH